MYKVFKDWDIDPPYDITWPKGVGWQFVKDRLPVPDRIKLINRSDFEKFYKLYTQAEMAKILQVSRKTVLNALKYHCIKRRSKKETYEWHADRKAEELVVEKQREQYGKLARMRIQICLECGCKATDPIKCFSCEYNDSNKYNHLIGETNNPPAIVESDCHPNLFAIEFG